MTGIGESRAAVSLAHVGIKLEWTYRVSAVTGSLLRHAPTGPRAGGALLSYAQLS